MLIIYLIRNVIDCSLFQMKEPEEEEQQQPGTEARPEDGGQEGEVEKKTKKGKRAKHQVQMCLMS